MDAHLNIYSVERNTSVKLFFYGAIFVLMMGLSPLSFLAIGWLILVVVRPTGRALLFSCAMVVVAMALTYASRRVGLSPFDDFANVYYPSYLATEDEALNAFAGFDWSRFSVSSMEIAWPILLLVLTWLPGKLTSGEMILCVTAVSGGLYTWWLYRYLLPLLPKSHQGAAAVVCLALYSFGLCSQLVRQMLCIPILLAALWEPRLTRSFLYAAVASAFHLSAAPVWAVVMLLRYGGLPAAIAMLVPLLLLMQVNAELASAIVGLDPGIFDKFTYYTEGIEDAAGYDITFLPLVIAVAVAGLFVRHQLDRRIGLILVVFAVLFVALLPLPLASFRITLFITAALVGPTICLAMAARLRARVFSFLCVGLGIAMMARRLWSNDPSNEMALWYLYPPVDIAPYYFVARIFGEL